MADVSSTDQLPIKVGQEYRVKLGKSFTFPKENAYHTIKCELFQPLWSGGPINIFVRICLCFVSYNDK